MIDINVRKSLDHSSIGHADIYIWKYGYRLELFNISKCSQLITYLWVVHHHVVFLFLLPDTLMSETNVYIFIGDRMHLNMINQNIHKC